jgi:hypothetical protein
MVISNHGLNRYAEERMIFYATEERETENSYSDVTEIELVLVY